MFNAAMRAQVHGVKLCTDGMGVERHLYALKCIAEEKGLEVPKLLTNRVRYLPPLAHARRTRTRIRTHAHTIALVFVTKESMTYTHARTYASICQFTESMTCTHTYGHAYVAAVRVTNRLQPTLLYPLAGLEEDDSQRFVDQ